MMLSRLRPSLSAAGAALGLLTNPSGGCFQRREEGGRFHFSLRPRFWFPGLQCRNVCALLGRGAASTSTTHRLWNLHLVKCAGGDGEGLPEPKRPRTNDWPQWEFSPMRRLRENGDGRQVQGNANEEPARLRDRMSQQVQELKHGHPSWNAYTDVLKGAVTMLEFANKASCLDWKSNLWKTKLLVALLLDDLRAHESGGFQWANNVWEPCADGLSADTIERLEQTTQTAMAMVAFGLVNLDGAPEASGRRPSGKLRRSSRRCPIRVAIYRKQEQNWQITRAKAGLRPRCITFRQCARRGAKAKVSTPTFAGEVSRPVLYTPVSPPSTTASSSLGKRFPRHPMTRRAMPTRGYHKI